MLRGQRDLKIITTLHGTDITLVGQELSFYAITKFSIEQSDAVTAVSAYLREETLRAFGIRRQIRVIPNFVNVEEYRPTAPESREGLAPAGHRVLSHASNFREVKRVRDVIRIFARVRKAMPATLLMIGDGPERADAEREARDLQVERDVRFLGRLDTIADLFQTSDLFLLPSQTESFGLAALEAMACGAPVVSTRVGGVPEMIEDGVTGILESPGAVEAMARRAIDLLRDPAGHRAMAEAAVRRAQDFSVERIIPQYEALYAEMVG
jgi:N-acetyl-alpha-D-glucosaminyl L-malate synthase BshA